MSKIIQESKLIRKVKIYEWTGTVEELKDGRLLLTIIFPRQKDEVMYFETHSGAIAFLMEEALLFCKYSCGVPLTINRGFEERCE